MKKKPNPGSDEAIKKGCICPVMDNCHGSGFAKDKDGNPCFYIHCGCPIHGNKKEAK